MEEVLGTYDVKEVKRKERFKKERVVIFVRCCCEVKIKDVIYCIWKDESYWWFF